MKIITIILNRIFGKPNPLPPGHYQGVIKNVVHDDLHGNIIVQWELHK